jgi:hypothetical protein
MAVQDRVVGPGAQANQDDPGHVPICLEPIHRILDVGQARLQGRQIIVSGIAVADTGEIKAQHGMAQACERARYRDVHAMMPDAMDNPGIENEDRGTGGLRRRHRARKNADQ